MIKRFRFLDAPGALDPAAVRAVTCTVVPELCDPEPPHAVIVVEWFDSDVTAEPDDLVAEEVVLRGAPWLEARWRNGGARWKHVALAVRNPALTQTELSVRWREHAGAVGAQSIPVTAQGRAYAQNHPLRTGRYDAVTEVWFDDLDGLDARATWFREHVDPLAPGGLFARSWFVAVREEPHPVL